MSLRARAEPHADRLNACPMVGASGAATTDAATMRHGDSLTVGATGAATTDIATGSGHIVCDYTYGDCADPMRKTRVITMADGRQTTTVYDAHGLVSESTVLMTDDASGAATADIAKTGHSVLMADDASGAATADIAKTGHRRQTDNSVNHWGSGAVVCGAATPSNIAHDAVIPEWLEDHELVDLDDQVDSATHLDLVGFGFEDEDPFGHGHQLDEEPFGE